jgi:hypothetical protein
MAIEHNNTRHSQILLGDMQAMLPALLRLPEIDLHHHADAFPPTLGGRQSKKEKHTYLPSKTKHNDTISYIRLS